MSAFRRNLLLSGLGGLLACGLAVAFCLWLIRSSTLVPPLPYPLITMLFVVVFGGFSVAEIPLMVFALLRLATERSGNRRLVWGLNSLYVFFAAVYGIPVLLITGNVAWGLALCALGAARFVTTLVFVQETRS